MTSRTQRRQFDWTQAHQALERTRRAIEGIDERDPAQVLAERARILAALAPEQDAVVAQDGVIEVLVFGAGGERYAFETGHIGLVTPRVPVTRLHGLPNYVVGIVAIEGEVFSVLDLRTLLQLPVARILDQHAIIVLRNQAMEFGVLAEEIHGVARLPTGELDHTLASAGAAHGCLAGVAPDGTTILDAERLLSDPKLVIDLP